MDGDFCPYHKDAPMGISQERKSVLDDCLATILRCAETSTGSMPNHTVGLTSTETPNQAIST